MDPTFLILLGFFALMYFVMIRPQQKKQKEHARMLSSLEVGHDVITIGGLHGTIVSMTDETIDLEVNDDTILRFQRSSIARDVTPEEPVAVETDETSAGA